VQTQIEQLLKLPDIQVLNVEITEHEIKCDIELTRGYSICHRCWQKATEFFEHRETLTLRHLPICEKDVYLYLKTKSITAFLKSTPEDLRATIKEVCTDLYEGFICYSLLLIFSTAFSTG
jgi:transposase